MKIKNVASVKAVGIFLGITTILIGGNIYRLNYNSNNDLVNSKSVVQSTYQLPVHLNIPTVSPYNNKVSRGEINREEKKEVKIKPTMTPKVIAKIEPKISKVEKTKKDDKGYVKKFTANVTKYSLHYLECGKHKWEADYGFTASDKYVVEGKTIAMSANYPFGTKIKIEGFSSTFVVEDRGQAIVSDCIDIFTNSRKESLRWGRKYLTAYVIEYPKSK